MTANGLSRSNSTNQNKEIVFKEKTSGNCDKNDEIDKNKRH